MQSCRPLLSSVRAALNQASGKGVRGSQTNNQAEQATIQGAKEAAIDQAQLGEGLLSASIS